MSPINIPLLLILFSQVAAQANLTCLNSNLAHLSTVNATLDNIQRIFEAQQSIDNQEACQIYLRFNSLKNQVFIRWGPASFMPTLSSQNMWIYTTVSFWFNAATEKLKDFSYVIDINIICASRNHCETDNIKDRFQQVNSTDYAAMINKIRPSLVPVEESPESGEDLSYKNNDMDGNCTEFSCTWSSDKRNHWEKTVCSIAPVIYFPVLILKTEEKIFEKYQISDQISSNSRKFDQHVLHFQFNIEQKCLHNDEVYGSIVKKIAESLYKQYPLWTRLKQKVVLRDENQGSKITPPQTTLRSTILSTIRKPSETESDEVKPKATVTTTKTSTTNAIVNTLSMINENIAPSCSLSKSIVFVFSLASFLNIILITKI